MYATVFNGGDVPVAVGDGRTVGGGEWGTVDTTNDEVVAALDARRLVRVSQPDSLEGIDPRAADAFRHADSVSAAAEHLQGQSKDDVLELAVQRGLVEEGTDASDVHVADLRTALVWDGVRAPQPPEGDAAAGDPVTDTVDTVATAGVAPAVGEVQTSPAEAADTTTTATTAKKASSRRGAATSSGSEA